MGLNAPCFARTVAPTMCTLDDWLGLLQATGFVAKVVYDRTPAAAQIAATLARGMRTYQQSLERELGDTGDRPHRHARSMVAFVRVRANCRSGDYCSTPHRYQANGGKRGATITSVEVIDQRKQVATPAPDHALHCLTDLAFGRILI